MNRAVSESETIFLTREFLGGGFAVDLYARRNAKGDVGLQDLSRAAKAFYGRNARNMQYRQHLDKVR